jgi:putative DNA primase/helicase
MTIPNFSGLPAWDPWQAVAPSKPVDRTPPSRMDELEALSVSDHAALFRFYVPDLSARPVAGKEYRGRCPIHGTSDSGANFSVNLETGRCRCLSRRCVEGHLHELVAAMNGWDLPKDLPKVKNEERRILGKSPVKGKPSKAMPETHTVESVAEGSKGDGYKSIWLCNASGSPRAILSNVLDTLRFDSALVGLIGWDAFACRPVLMKEPPWASKIQPGAEWPAEFDVLLAVYLQRAGLMVGTSLVMEAVGAIAHENSFHPVRDYLGALKWDGDRRLDVLMTEYFGAGPSEFVIQAAKKWLIGAVARIFQPGCKVDTMLILEGRQGVGKSTALAVLAGEWFTDTLGDIEKKEAVEQIQGKWIVEVAELDSLSKAEESKIKQFLSCSSDRYRPAYGRRALDAPRQCVFAGTTNGEAYLKDYTGGRRFWPVKCGVVDVERLRRDRDQIWAEAVAEYLDGAAWWLSEEMEVDAKAEQATRRQEDSWTPLIESWLLKRVDRLITTNDVLQICLEKHKSTCTRADQMRVGTCLRALGWERVRMQIDGVNQWVYQECK